jgi:hypothetical protein
MDGNKDLRLQVSLKIKLWCNRRHSRSRRTQLLKLISRTTRAHREGGGTETEEVGDKGTLELRAKSRVQKLDKIYDQMQEPAA